MSAAQLAARPRVNVSVVRLALLAAAATLAGCYDGYFTANGQLAESSRATGRAITQASEWMPSLCRRHAELEYLNQRATLVTRSDTPGFPTWFARHQRDAAGRTWKQRCDELRLVSDAVDRSAVILIAFADAIAGLTGIGAYAGDDFRASTAALGDLAHKLSSSPYAPAVSGAGQAFSKVADVLFNLWVSSKTTQLLQSAEVPLHDLIASTRQIMQVVRREELADARAQLADLHDLVEARRQQRDVAVKLTGPDDKPLGPSNDPLHVLQSFAFADEWTARFDAVDRRLDALDAALVALDGAQAELVAAWTHKGKAAGAASLKTVQARTQDVQQAVQRFAFAGESHD